MYFKIKSNLSVRRSYIACTVFLRGWAKGSLVFVGQDFPDGYLCSLQPPFARVDTLLGVIAHKFHYDGARSEWLFSRVPVYSANLMWVTDFRFCYLDAQFFYCNFLENFVRIFGLARIGFQYAVKMKGISASILLFYLNCLFNFSAVPLVASGAWCAKG
jgi:hypothetical protein